MVGSLLYLSLTCRPDIAQAVGVLSRFMSCPSLEHIEAAKRVVRYLYHTKEMGITYRRGSFGGPQWYVKALDKSADAVLLMGCADADWGGDEDSRKSTSGYAMILQGGLVSWLSKLQPTVALSTAEAETISAVEAVKQIIHLRLMLDELGQTQGRPTKLQEDNSATIYLSNGKENSKKAKHYQAKVFFLKDRTENRVFEFEKVETENQLADAFTKPLGRKSFEKFRSWMGLCPPLNSKK